MRKFMGTASILSLLLLQCTEKPDKPAPYRPSFDSFEISYHAWMEKSFSVRVDSNKAFICDYGRGENTFSFGILPDTLLQYFDSTYERLKSESTGLKNKVDCDDCTCTAVIIRKGRDSIIGLTCDWPEDHGNLRVLKDRLDSFLRKKPYDQLYGHIYFPTMLMLVTPPPKILSPEKN